MDIINGLQIIGHAHREHSYCTSKRFLYNFNFHTIRRVCTAAVKKGREVLSEHIPSLFCRARKTAVEELVLSVSQSRFIIAWLEPSSTGSLVAWLLPPVTAWFLMDFDSSIILCCSCYTVHHTQACLPCLLVVLYYDRLYIQHGLLVDKKVSSVSNLAESQTKYRCLFAAVVPQSVTLVTFCLYYTCVQVYRIKQHGLLVYTRKSAQSFKFC